MAIHNTFPYILLLLTKKAAYFLEMLVYSVINCPVKLVMQCCLVLHGFNIGIRVIVCVVRALHIDIVNILWLGSSQDD